jgi:hypothetical protein
MSRARFSAGVVTAICAAPVLLIGGIALMRASPAPSQLVVSPVTAPPPPAPLVGVYELAKSATWQPVAQFGASVAPPTTVEMFTGIGQRFPARFAKVAHQHGATLLIQINPGKLSLRKIADGAYDKWIAGYAGQVAAFRLPVIIGFGHEMNGWWYPWGYTRQPARDFVAAWRHLVTVFRSHGAGNVTWLWTISHGTRPGSKRPTAPLREYWPGRKYVSWVGIDGYYYYSTDTFSSVFGPKLREVRQLTSRPVLLSEVGIGQVAGQARKIPGLFRGIIRQHLLGLVWYDVHQNIGPYHQDWRLEGNAGAITAFRRGVALLRAQRG